eukprot:TRINITY_DN3793_c0_g3_i2.p1 TRINITY_DN3793_c0_g3~~TRINITY_DN3793_c0_g3_i2.p1  ORF type:complete len:220 (-),score=10.49 TRINITY_DN3793_c0_g3_i2:94-708(-)
MNKKIMSDTKSNEAPKKSWLTLNMGSSQQVTTENNTESSGFFHNLFSSIKESFVDAREGASDFNGSFLYFVIGLAIGWAFVLVSLLFLPLVIIAPYKFCVFFTLGSLCIFASFVFLHNPVKCLILQFTGKKAIFTACYLGSLLLCFYASAIKKNYIATLVLTCLQMVAMMWFVCSHFPGGITSMKVLASCFVSMGQKCLQKAIG